MPAHSYGRSSKKTLVWKPALPPPQRANAAVREPELQAYWQQERIYERLSEENTGEKYVLHDGPPYANGDLHMGHAMNKVSQKLYTVMTCVLFVPESTQ